MRGSPERLSIFGRVVSRVREISTQRRELQQHALAEKVWGKTQDTAWYILNEFYLKNNTPIPDQYLDALFRVGLHEATFYAFYSSDEEDRLSNREHLPTTVFRQIERRFTKNKSGVYDAILHTLGTTNLEVTGSLIDFYRSEVLLNAEDTVATYKKHTLYRLGADVVRGQIVKSVLELLPRMKSIEASVRKS